VDGLVNLRVMVLYADRNADEADVAQLADAGRIDGAWIDLQAQFGIGRELEMSPQQCPELANLVSAQESGRAAAQVHLANGSIAVEARRDQPQLLFQIDQKLLASRG